MLRPLRSLLLSLPALAFAALPAHATLVGQIVTVALTDGGSLSLADSVAVGAGAEITPGDGTNIGGAMLPNEAVDLSAFSILIRLEEGLAGGATGYPLGTRLEFTSLVFSDPSLRITGVTVTLGNISGVTLGAQVVFTGNSVSLFIDTLTIGELPNAVDVGTVRLDLTVASVPEPHAAWLLALAGSGLLALGTRGRG
jgi:hypothetical protein